MMSYIYFTLKKKVLRAYAAGLLTSLDFPISTRYTRVLEAP